MLHILFSNKFPQAASFCWAFGGWIRPGGHMSVCYQDTRLALNLLTAYTCLTNSNLPLQDFFRTHLLRLRVGNSYKNVTKTNLTKKKKKYIFSCDCLFPREKKISCENWAFFTSDWLLFTYEWKFLLFSKVNYIHLYVIYYFSHAD